ncbi:alpha-amylase family protein [Vibrio agarivorans]|uniref:alpha-amylase family protein n=1 Tax=Vibrio agarivorans TaxID=153622 RepID=UPI0025B36B91|nr:alpha-amylase family protein [Vibrio agarivorans]MDN3663625.1 alpha-amylase family protein [Vibrio agarivorans]
MNSNYPKHSNVILHAFDWPYSLVAQRAEEIRAAGYKTVLVSPPMKSYKSEQGTQWWQRYQPQDYRVIDNQLGNTDDFKAMIEALNEHGVWLYVDVVFNHMANESSLRTDLVFPNAQNMAAYKADATYFEQQKLFGDLSQPLFDETDFLEAFPIEDWKDPWQVQTGRISGGPQDPGLPSLSDNAHVVEQQRAYLKALKSLGVKGFRIDAAKHLTLEHLAKVWTDDIVQDVHIFGEIITDGGATEDEYELFLQPYLEHTRLAAYDFPLFQTLFDALDTKGSLKSLIDPYSFGQALSSRRAITFAVTHDIPNNDVFSNLVMQEQDEWMAYTYILGRDGGVPLIYTDLDTSGIKDSNKQPRWLNAWHDTRMQRRIDFHNRMHGEIMELIEASDDLLVFYRGEVAELAKGVVALNKSKRAQTVTLELDGEWYDLLSGKLFSAKEGSLTLSIDAKNSLMLVHAN